MSLTLRFAIAAGAAVAASSVLLAKRRQQAGAAAPQGSREPPASPTDPQPTPGQQRAAACATRHQRVLPGSARRLYAAQSPITLLAAVLATAAAAAAALRGHVDLAAVIAAAWCLIILQQAVAVDGSPHAAAPAAVRPSASLLGAQADHVPQSELVGTWIKDGKASDSMEPALRLMRLNGITCTAVKLIRGVRLTLDRKPDDAGYTFTFAVFSIISWFKVVETYALDGAQAHHRRRDLRRGRSTGAAQVTPAGGILLRYHWGEPRGGSGEDVFLVEAPEGRLVVRTTLCVGGASVRYKQVYRKDR